jgi:TrmH RNA methyltransferase
MPPSRYRERVPQREGAGQRGRVSSSADRSGRRAAALSPATGARPGGDPAAVRDTIAICGLPAVQALVARDPARVERLFFEPHHAAALTAARHVLARFHKPYREVGDDELARIAGTVRHGGVVAVARRRPLPMFDPAPVAGWARRQRPLLVLDGIGNPHNLGAILRSAAYFGIEHAILADRPEQALPSAASYRVAEGALEYVRLYRAPLPAALAVLRRGGFRVVGTVLGRAVPLAEWRGDKPVALVLGNEERGVDPATLALCDGLVTIPGAAVCAGALPGAGVQSLNVAAAAAILFYVLTAR